MEITAIGMGLMMTGVGVAVGVVMLEAAFLMLGRALRDAPLAASLEPAAIHSFTASPTVGLALSASLG
jgi:hypothetical protein